MADQFFTPENVAEKLVASTRARKIQTIADFAAGDGVLLCKAEARWPETTIIATDIDSKCVRRLKKEHQEWRVGKCDFLNPDSRARSSALKSVSDGVDLILLNPPFGSGIKLIGSRFNDVDLRCSVAMAFVLNSLNYLTANGRILAILPTSTFKSCRDSQSWKLVKKSFTVSKISCFGKEEFAGCSARTTLVRIDRSKRSDVVSTRAPTAIYGVKIVRGAVPIHVATNGLAGPGYSIVHTSDLDTRNLASTQHSITQLRRAVVGPAVLIPRVGLPTSNKCVLYLKRERLVLSDCVIALKCKTTDEAKSVQRILLKNWKSFQSGYDSTCAPYITIDDLISNLARFKIAVQEIDKTKFHSVHWLPMHMLK